MAGTLLASFNGQAVTLKATKKALEDGELIERIAYAFINNAQQGTQLMYDPNYFNNVKANFLPNIQSVVSLSIKSRLGERLMTDYGYALEIAKKALRIACAGVASLDNQGQQESRALLPVFLAQDGNLLPITDEQILAMVTEFSNSPVYIDILNRQGFI